ncbi:MAG: hypothetical protein GY790_21835 [Bacteroidetes bacterium]|nr:hypothetical protein [Bacteroidota bacterium]
MQDTELNHDGIISVSFNDTVSHTANGLSSGDCGALVSFGDTLFMFTMNWVNQSSSVFVIPQNPGHYHPSPVNTFQAHGEGVCYDPEETCGFPPRKA